VKRKELFLYELFEPGSESFEASAEELKPEDMGDNDVPVFPFGKFIQKLPGDIVTSEDELRIFLCDHSSLSGEEIEAHIKALKEGEG
jgi:hypothetical protein